MAKRTAAAILAMTCAAATARSAIADAGAGAGADADAGRTAIATLQWQDAVRIFTPLAAAAAPGTPEWTQATFCLAVAQNQLQPPSADTIGAAARLFQSIIDRSADPRYVARSMMNLGRIAELRDYSADVIDLPKARQYYAQVIEKFPNDPIASEAALRQGAAFIMEYDAPGFEKAKTGVARIEKWLAGHPGDALASVMWQTAGDAYFMPLDDWKNALRCYEKVDTIGWTDAGNQGASYWRCSQIAESLKDTKTAVRYYTKIINETPNSGQGYAAVLALRRLGAPVPANPLFDDPATRPSASATTSLAQEARR